MIWDSISSRYYKSNNHILTWQVGMQRSISPVFQHFYCSKYKGLPFSRSKILKIIEYIHMHEQWNSIMAASVSNGCDMKEVEQEKEAILWPGGLLHEFVYTWQIFSQYWWIVRYTLTWQLAGSYTDIVWLFCVMGTKPILKLSYLY